VPYFRRKLRRIGDTQRFSEVLDTAVNRLGLKVPTAFVHDVLGLPQADQDEVIVRGAAG
jgi:phage gp29-like protein